MNRFYLLEIKSVLPLLLWLGLGSGLAPAWSQEIVVPTTSWTDRFRDKAGKLARGWQNDIELRAEELRSEFWDRRLRVEVLGVGLRAGGQLLPVGQILGDRDRRYTEEVLRPEPGVWVRMRYQLRPARAWAIERKGLAFTPDVAANLTLQTVRRVPIPRDWARTTPDLSASERWRFGIEVLKRHEDQIFRLPVSREAYREYLPGEQFAIEGFSRVSLSLGPALALPAALQANIGVRASRLQGHFRVVYSVEPRGVLRLILAEADQWTAGLSAGAGVGVRAFGLGVRQNLLTARLERAQTDLVIRDWSIRVSECSTDELQALAQTATGDFVSLEQAGTRCLEKRADVDLRSQSSDGSFWTPLFAASRTQLRADEATDASPVPPDYPGDARLRIHQLGDFVRAPRTRKWIKATIVDDLSVRYPIASRTLKVEVRVEGRGFDDRTREIWTRVARHLRHLEVVNPTLLDPAVTVTEGRFRGWLSIEWSPEALQAMLELLPEERLRRYYDAWAEAAPDASRPLREAAERFERHLRKSLLDLEARDPQARAFEDAVRAIDYDPLPLLALIRLSGTDSVRVGVELEGLSSGAPISELRQGARFREAPRTYFGLSFGEL